MYRQRYGGRLLIIHAGNHIVGYQYHIGSGIDSCLKRQKVRIYKCFIRTFIISNTGVRIGVIAISREML